MNFIADDKVAKGRVNGSAVVTNSRLRKWWLSAVCGYTIEDTKHEPKPGLFGRITYLSTWRLSRK